MKQIAMVAGVLLLVAPGTMGQTLRPSRAACDALRQIRVTGVVLTVTKTKWCAAGAPLPGRARRAGPAAK